MGSEAQLPLVLLIRPLFPPFEDGFETKFHLVRAWESGMPLHLFLAKHGHSIRALLCCGLAPVDTATLRSLPNLGCVVTTATGVNNIDMAECKSRGIAVANAGTVFSEDGADYAVGILLDLLRRISASDRYVRQGLWSLNGEFSSPLGFKLSGKRVGIVGLGSIGSKVAKRLEAFGCRISYHSRTKKPTVSYSYFSNVCDLAAKTDVLILTCALTQETHHLINREVLLALGKEGVVVNVGRGPLIDEKELVKCLVEGEIGGASLDVFEDEPVVPKELFALDNVVLSHHTAVFTEESLSALLQLMIENLEAFFLNKPLVTPVEA